MSFLTAKQPDSNAQDNKVLQSVTAKGRILKVKGKKGGGAEVPAC